MKAQHIVRLLALIALIVFIYFTAQRSRMGSRSMMYHQQQHQCSFADVDADDESSEY